jgi:uncharacterized protein (TIGR03435 family)
LRGSCASEAGTGDFDTLPTLFTMLEEELGLKLEASKRPVDTIVIDGASRPSED